MSPNLRLLDPALEDGALIIITLLRQIIYHQQSKKKINGNIQRN